MRGLKIEYLPPGDLKPYENNARKHAPHDVDAIIASIEKFGFSDPIGIWSDKNIIVEGHGRQIAALQMGLSEVPCIRLDHLTDEQRRAYALAHNKTAELSEWDFDRLEEELAQLQIDGIDMTEFDFAGADDGVTEPAGASEPSFHYQEQYAVTVMCKDEEDQQSVYERLTQEGYECKVVCV